MTVLSELTDLLKQWTVWKRVEEAPNRIDELEQRVKALEEALAKCPGEGCSMCGERAMRLTWQSGAKGPLDKRLQAQTWTCAACGHAEARTKHL